TARWTISNDAMVMTIERGLDGHLGMTELRNRADGREWVVASTPSPLFQLQYRVGGETYALTGRSDLEVRSAAITTESGGGQLLTIVAFSPDAKMQIALRWRCPPGSGPIEKSYEIENQGTLPVRIVRADTWSQLLNTPRGASRLLWVHKGTYSEGLLRVHDHLLREGETQELLSSGTEAPAHLSL